MIVDWEASAIAIPSPQHVFMRGSLRTFRPANDRKISNVSAIHRSFSSEIEWQAACSHGELMTKEELQRRTKQYGIDVIALTRELPRSPAADHVSGQLIRSGTAVGANYRASCRAKSRADFISKMGTVEEEADESVYWLEVLIDSKLIAQTSVERLLNEGQQLVKIVVASINTARGGTR